MRARVRTERLARPAEEEEQGPEQGEQAHRHGSIHGQSRAGAVATSYPHHLWKIIDLHQTGSCA
jgi:hypothetical protein